MPSRSALVLTALVATVAVAPAHARTTLDRTIDVAPGPGLRALHSGPGEPYLVRQGVLGRARPGRAARRRSVSFFGQLTDPQVADEMSPARVELIDPAGGDARSAHRPYEALGLQTFDQVVRSMNAARRSAVRGRGGRRARLGFALTTGDLADNQQRNEVRWFRTVLDGGRVDPFSGRPVTATNPCGGASAEDVARLNADVAARRYTGVQDFADWPDRPLDRYVGFWDPDRPPGGAGLYAGWGGYPGLMDRAQRPFVAAGLDVPWYASRGNHDGLVQGNVAASFDLARTLVASCIKVLPSDRFDPAELRGGDEADVFRRLNDAAFVERLLAGAEQTPPDRGRRFVGPREFRRLVGHGYARVPRRELRASAGAASFYAFTRDRIRFVALDTVAEGGGAEGNIDHAQFRWLRRELRTATRRRRLVVVFGHHTLETMDNTRSDEAAGRCTEAGDAGCDRDPRRSRPLHRGLAGRDSVRDLLLAHRAVVAYVAGHTHRNGVRAFGRRGRGFWQISTASHVDFPQQSRTIEVIDNRDGTLSLFATVLDHAAPVTPPPPGTPADAMTDAQLASLSRQLAASDPQPPSAEDETAGPAAGRRADRNVELVVRDPRR